MKTRFRTIVESWTTVEYKIHVSMHNRISCFNKQNILKQILYIYIYVYVLLFSRSAVPDSFCNPMDYNLSRLALSLGFPSKNTGVREKARARTEKGCFLSSRSKPHPCSQLTHEYSSLSFQFPPFYLHCPIYMVTQLKLNWKVDLWTVPASPFGNWMKFGLS